MPTPTRSSLRRVVYAALILTQFTACQTWRAVPGPLDQQVGAKPLSHARVRLRDGSELSLREVTVRADSVIGYSEDTGERRARSVVDVTSIEQRQVSAGRTTGVVLASTTVALAALIIAALVAAGPGLSAGASPGAH